MMHVEQRGSNTMVVKWTSCPRMLILPVRLLDAAPVYTAELIFNRALMQCVAVVSSDMSRGVGMIMSGKPTRNKLRDHTLEAILSAQYEGLITPVQADAARKELCNSHS